MIDTPFVDPIDFYKTCDPLLRVLNYSGGKQSTWLLWELLLGLRPLPDNLIVLNADPGMENCNTYKHVAAMKSLCDLVGIHFETVQGPNLYNDLLALKGTGKTRFDTPAYWTKDAKGKLGKLKQKCTREYKVAPMDRAIRRILSERFGISPKSGRLPANCVEKWIGFSASEIMRIKPSSQKYVYFRYPLIEDGLTNAQIVGLYLKHGKTIPPRSVCNACFANGVDTLREMHQNRPGDWAQAVAVDAAVRDWSQIGVREQVYISKTLTPLEQLAAQDFKLTTNDESMPEGLSCDSGYCLT